MKLVKQGAEARIYENNFMGRDSIVKERFCKKYRLAELDKKLTIKRILQESRSIYRCNMSGVLVPCLYHVDLDKGIIEMEKLHGDTIKESIEKSELKISGLIIKDILNDIGISISKLHNINLIHGDLTTSNLIITINNKIALIDFGLSFVSNLVEDKAVDLYVLERAISSTTQLDLFGPIMESYLSESNNSKSIMSKLHEVRLRGRKRDMTG